MHIKDTFPELYQLRRPVRLEKLRERLGEKQGKEYWRSLEELAETPEFEEFLHREFPAGASEWDERTDRRTFLKLMGASLALAGLSGCSYQPPEGVLPYVRDPEGLLPGKPLYFATAMPMPGAATPLLVRSNEGRPTKIEGNPEHPVSQGATDTFAQASILTLYDPDRSQTPVFRGDIRSYTAFLGELTGQLEAQLATQGAGIRLLTGAVTSPTMAAQIAEMRQRFPLLKWHQYEPAGANNVSLGAQMAFGQPVSVLYRFDQADRILSLGSDFLSCGPASLRYARDFANRRRLRQGSDPEQMNRLYVVETSPTNTGMVADHRLAVRPSEMEAYARAFAAALGVGGALAVPMLPHGEWIAAVAGDLQTRRGRAVVIVGDEQPPIVHALAHAMNQALGSIGTAVVYGEPLEVNPVDHLAELRDLITDIDAGRAQVLVIVGGNPVYDTPADLKLTPERIRSIPFSVHLSLYQDETSEQCRWHIPEAHYLESWSDARAYDGTVSIIQPLIAPLYQGRTVHEFLAAFSDRPQRSSYDIVREYWQTRAGTGDFEAFWRRAVHDGYIPNTGLQARNVTVDANFAPGLASTPATQAGTLEIEFRPDPSVYDGRFANNGWLQELPKPLTKLTWDNVAIMSQATAHRLGLSYDNHETTRGSEFSAEVVELRFRGQTVSAPVWIMPGQPDDCITVHLGYGRTRAGRVGGTHIAPVGFNAYQLRTSDSFWSGAGLEIVRTGSRYPLASTQTHFSLEHDEVGHRDIVRSGTLEQYRREPKMEPAGGHHTASGPEVSMYPEFDYSQGYAWGMAIDLGTCVGCNACIVACQAENNIPIVGKDQVARGREMHWLRVDAYFRGAVANPQGVHFMPVPCMHCEKAPCEPVCPVHATVHSAEGLNDMVYNRCVGTRYCSNNCPYKVRRFNFLLYQDWNTPSLRAMRNPDVTVRSRGVMEKCTYCVQRIQYAKIESNKEGRRVRDGEIVTACQAACPTEAIIFGDINDQNSRVAQMKREPRNYSLLHELNTQPRTTYLASVRNVNEEVSRLENARG